MEKNVNQIPFDGGRMRRGRRPLDEGIRPLERPTLFVLTTTSNSRFVEEKGYSRDDVYNVGENGVNWKALPRKSLASKWESTAPSFKVSKERVTTMTSVQESDPIEDKTDEDEDNNNSESSKGPSNTDAFSALETAMEWYKQQSECCPTQLLLLKRIRDIAVKNKGVQ
ncbi:hypothetical protein TNCV_4273791 [Trichonephila clavipes]|nr:hypothetical protein TNCV_4273791 [Trichonephila clavipes]